VPEFIPGLELAGLYYAEAVKPILDAEYPELVHSATLIGTGSEVLGLDTEMSADHNWGPRLMIFLLPDDHARLSDELHEILGYKLPFTFRGYPTHFAEVPDEPGTVWLEHTESRPINHQVTITTLRGFIQPYIGIDLDRELTVIDWLTIPEQFLREELSSIRKSPERETTVACQSMDTPEVHLLGLYLTCKEARPLVEDSLDLEVLSEPLHRSIFQKIMSRPFQDVGDLEDHLTGEEFSVVTHAAMKCDIDRAEIERNVKDILTRLNEMKRRRRIKEIETEIRVAERSGDEEKLGQLKIQLDALIREGIQ